MDETLDEKKRALNAVKAIDDALAEVSRLHPQLCTKRVKWDHDDPKTAALLGTNPVEYRHLTGEMVYRDEDLEMAIHVGRDASPDSAVVRVYLNEPLALPHDPGELCDALACCLDRSIIPEMDHDEHTDELFLGRLSVTVLIESLTSRVLRDALDRLSEATVLLRTYLSQYDEQRAIDRPTA